MATMPTGEPEHQNIGEERYEPVAADSMEEVRENLSFRTSQDLENFTSFFLSRILEAWTVYSGEVTYPDSVYLADVDEGLHRFKAELEIAHYRDDAVVCALVDEDSVPVPVDSRAVLATIGREQVHFEDLMDQDRLWRRVDVLDSMVRTMGLDSVVVNSAAAVEFFQSHLHRFLRLRFLGGLVLSAAPEAGPPSAPTPSDCLRFRVHTQNSGLRIRYSPAYLLGQGTVFGAPSTPVDGWLRPSAYIFGGEDAGGLKWDSGIYDLPPATEAHLVSI